MWLSPLIMLLSPDEVVSTEPDHSIITSSSHAHHFI